MAPCHPKGRSASGGPAQRVDAVTAVRFPAFPPSCGNPVARLSPKAEFPAETAHSFSLARWLAKECRNWTSAPEPLKINGLIQVCCRPCGIGGPDRNLCAVSENEEPGWLAQLMGRLILIPAFILLFGFIFEVLIPWTLEIYVWLYR